MKVLTPRDLVNWQPHNEFEEEVIAYLKSEGFLVHPWGYEKTFDRPIVDVLKFRDSPTALYIRTLADYMAVHPTQKLEFLFDAKTAGKSKYRNWAIEAAPLALKIGEAKHGIQCLYVYQNKERGINVGFWNANLPHISEIQMPMRWEDSKVNWFKTLFAERFPGIPCRQPLDADGSRDPFVVIQWQNVQKLPHWKVLIKQELERIKKAA